MKRTSAFLFSRSLRRMRARYHSLSREKRADTRSPVLGGEGREVVVVLWWVEKEDMRVLRAPVVEGDMIWSFRWAVVGSMWVMRTSR